MALDWSLEMNHCWTFDLPMSCQPQPLISVQIEDSQEAETLQLPTFTPNKDCYYSDLVQEVQKWKKILNDRLSLECQTEAEIHYTSEDEE